eukprot:snap_masked-scaffold_1-processed-gene-29.35-mRNA-1 protein AED:1.00 eAED:1.00 QI:0/0/0/0/1/1/2/0/90
MFSWELSVQSCPLARDGLFGQFENLNFVALIYRPGGNNRKLQSSNWGANLVSGMDNILLGNRRNSNYLRRRAHFLDFHNCCLRVLQRTGK